MKQRNRGNSKPQQLCSIGFIDLPWHPNILHICPLDPKLFWWRQRKPPVGANDVAGTGSRFPATNHSVEGRQTQASLGLTCPSGSDSTEWVEVARRKKSLQKVRFAV
jgi:hypothetical protein